MAQGSLNTGALNGTHVRVADMLNRESFRGVSRREGKVMSGVPTVVSDVHDARNTGLPTGRETYGDGVPIVVRGRESRLHGEVGQVGHL
jgi:hypothetical protein